MAIPHVSVAALATAMALSAPAAARLCFVAGGSAARFRLAAVRRCQSAANAAPPRATTRCACTVPLVIAVLPMAHVARPLPFATPTRAASPTLARVSIESRRMANAARHRQPTPPVLAAPLVSAAALSARVAASLHFVADGSAVRQNTGTAHLSLQTENAVQPRATTRCACTAHLATVVHLRASVAHQPRFAASPEDASPISARVRLKEAVCSGKSPICCVYIEREK